MLWADARSRGSLVQVHPLVQEPCREKLERDKRRGIRNRPIRAMVCGIPNVGKSTFINSIAGRASAKTGNRPGVTRGKQWIRLNKSLELLDTPGILWPRFDDPLAGEHLAMIGSVNDNILNTEELALRLIAFLTEAYPQALSERYGIAAPSGSLDGDRGPSLSGEDIRKEGADGHDSLITGDDTDEFARIAEKENAEGALQLSPEAKILRQIAESRNCVLRGGEFDWEKAAGILLDEFRGGVLGRMTLEVP